MFDRLRTVLLRVLRVPPEPEPPFGAPQSVRVFRAGRNYYRLRLLAWAVGQVGALAGIVFSLWFFHQVGTATEEHQSRQALATNAASAAMTTTNGVSVASARKVASRRGENWKRPTREWLARLAANWPKWIIPLLALFEVVGLGFYLVQVVLTYAAVRLDFELRWYVVTDRSLRIRSGVWSVQEMTMSFANLQQVMVSQGPLQRLLGIADLRVESAGGGGGIAEMREQHQDSMHTGVFHGVDNANELRDLILARLRSFRETGLGDPDEMSPMPPPTPNASPTAVLVAARELLAETQALRAAWHLRRRA